MHPGAQQDANNVKFYAVKHVWASVYDGNGVNFVDLLQHDPDVISRALQRADSGVRIVPFFRYYEAEEGSIPGTLHPAHRDVATITDPDTKAEYVVAQLGGRLILILLPDYQAAGLPMHESAANPSPEPNPKAH
jgi:hypothetical protein